MAKRLTIHAAESPRETWLEVDGEIVEGIEAVQFVLVDGEPHTATLIFEPGSGVEVAEEWGD